jgi:hypothetical protein
MNSTRRTAIISALANRLASEGSWCGETHIQKATYLLEQLAGVKLGFDFTLYKHGPYSFDLRDHLAAMRADRYIDVQPQPDPYGPSLLPTLRGQRLSSRSSVVGRHRDAIDWVAKTIGRRRVSELERLATALYMTARMPYASVGERAGSIHELKPHVSYQEAFDAIEEIETLRRSIPKDHAPAASDRAM